MPAFTGEIRMFAGNFEPAGWFFCDGRLLNISEYSNLFIVIGTTYGGDGVETFGLPDLRGRVPVHQGSSFVLGENGGTETVTLIPNNLPAHQHLVTGAVYIPSLGQNPGKSLVPDNTYPSIVTGTQLYSTSKTDTSHLPPLKVTPSSGGNMMTVTPAGNSQPFDNMQPYIVVNFIINPAGEFPSQT